MTTTDIDCRLNIHKRREKILYRGHLSPSASSISYAGSSTINSEDSLGINDKSASLVANRKRNIEAVTVENTQTLTLNTDQFAITDEYTETKESVTTTPLFYKHVLDTTKVTRTSTGALSSGISIIDYEILDENLQPVKVTEKKLDSTNGWVYNNLTSYYKTDTDYVVYYVRYTINDNDTVNTYVDLLNNELVFVQADIDDLDDTMQIIDDGRQVYLIEQTASGYIVTLPTPTTYSYLILDTAKIEIVPPISATIDEPWYVKVSDGEFFAQVNNTQYKYHIAEFLSQSFSPTAPTKYVSSEESTIVNKILIKADNSYLKHDTDEDMEISILINDSDDEGVAAYTTDSDLDGTSASNGETYTKWTTTNRTGIKSIDQKAGYLDIDGLVLKSTYKIYSTYYYDETAYEFTTINFNPVSNQEATEYLTTLFVDPDTATSEKTQTLYYLKSDETGKVVESNWDTFDNDTGMLTVSGWWLYYDSFPSWKDDEPHGVFKDLYAVGGGIGNYLVLGDISVSPPTRIEDITILDSRRRGGGIIDEEYSGLLDDYPEIRWINDEGQWDGQSYPGNASFYAEIPIEVLDGAGGDFTQQQVRDIINKHNAAGVYPIIKTYGVDVTVSGIYPSTTSITVQWNGNDYYN